MMIRRTAGGRMDRYIIITSPLSCAHLEQIIDSNNKVAVTNSYIPE